MSIDFSEYTFNIADPKKKKKIMDNIDRYISEGTDIDKLDAIALKFSAKKEAESKTSEREFTLEEEKDITMLPLFKYEDKFKAGEYDDPDSTVIDSWIEAEGGKIRITPRDLDATPQAFAKAMDILIKELEDFKVPAKPVIIRQEDKDVILDYLKDYKAAFKDGKYYHPNDRIMIARLWVGDIAIEPEDLGARKEDFDRAMDDMIATLAEHGLKGEPAVVID